MLIIGGLGGIGKTQLAITYAKRYQRYYNSIFWLNANSEDTLKASIRSLANRVQILDVKNNTLDDEQICTQVSKWLSEKGNTNWLLIFDNHDRPEQYNIKKYYPYASHGSIIITTRSPELLTGSVIRVQRLESIDESLRILETRSARKDVGHGMMFYTVIVALQLS